LPETRYFRTETGPMLEEDLQESSTARQEAVPGFDQAVVRRSGILFGGAGGLTAEQAIAQVRKGYRYIAVTDMDCFAPSNYPRQLCYAQDLYQSKGVCVAQNLVRECISETELIGLGLPFEDALMYLDISKYDVWVINVDNNETRTAAARVAREHGKSVIISGVSADANSGYVFVQEAAADTACWGCAFPHKVNDVHHPCPNTPACRDILKAVGALVIYAVDSLIMPRPRNWNVRHCFLAGFLPDSARTVARNPLCPLCSADR